MSVAVSRRERVDSVAAVFRTFRELATYVDSHPVEELERVLDRAKIGSVLLCDCGAIANTIHCLPWFRPGMRILPACPDSDPGGYFFDLGTPVGLWADFDDWERHLNAKDPDAWLQFQRWLNAQ